MKRKIGALGLTFLILGFVLFPIEGAIGVSTLGIWVTIPAGEKVTGTLTFTNYHEEETKLVIKLCDWTRLEDGKNILLEPNSLPESLTPYIKVTPEETIFKPGESRKFKYEISMPENVTGALWGAMLAIPQRRLDDQKDSKTSKLSKVSLNELAPYGFTVKIWALEPTTANPSGQINSVKVVNSQKNESEKRFEIDFENTGNVPLRPEGSLRILDSGEKEIATFNIDRFGILPGSRRILKIPSVETTVPDGDLKAEVILTYTEKNQLKKKFKLQ